MDQWPHDVQSGSNEKGDWLENREAAQMTSMTTSFELSSEEA